MTLPSALFVVRWLIRDTFRQSLSSGVFWLMLGVSGLCLAVCLSVSTVDLPLRTPDSERLPASEGKTTPPDKLKGEGVDVIQGTIRLGFGAVPVPWNKYRDDAVRFLQLILVGLVADTGGILLALIFTAGFLPSFLEAQSASVLLAKPTPRWVLLVGKYLGVLAFVAFQTLVFVGGVWFGLGVKTGVWDGTCFLAVPVLLLHFAVFFSISVLLAVTTRSTVASVFGSLLFWFLCLGMNLGRHSVRALPEMETLSPAFLTLVDAGYWVLPKPADFGVLLIDALRVSDEFAGPFDRAALDRGGYWNPGMSLLASALFAVAVLFVSAREFENADY